MNLEHWFPKALVSIVISCSQCGKRISKETLYCEGCNIKHRVGDNAIQ